MKHLLLITVLPLAALMAACAGAPAAPSAAEAQGPRDCAQLEADIAALHATRREAEQKKGEAWKAVVPFAVAGRYASANAALRDAEQRLATLRDEAQRRGCMHHV